MTRAVQNLEQSRQTRRFAAYNCFNLYRELRGDYGQVIEVIRDLDADVIAVQEIISDHPDHAAQLLARLAKATGMTAAVTPARYSEDGGSYPTYAVGPGPHGFNVGLMWRDDPDITPVPDTLRSYGGEDFWHALVKLTLLIDGQAITFASYHATPYGRQQRADQAERVLAAITRPPGPALLGGDINCVGAVRVPDGDGGWKFYDDDPYQPAAWLGDFVYQCDWRYDQNGSREYWADRRPADIWISGGLHDAAAALNAPWMPTTGHHPEDTYGPHGIHRRIDAIYSTADMVPRLRTYDVFDTPNARQASDHLPVLVTFEI